MLLDWCKEKSRSSSRNLGTRNVGLTLFLVTDPKASMEETNDDVITSKSSSRAPSHMQYSLGSKKHPLSISFDLTRVVADEVLHSTSQNTGHILWDSSYIMGHWLALHGDTLWQASLIISRPNVIELGCGLGLCSLVRPAED